MKGDFSFWHYITDSHKKYSMKFFEYFWHHVWKSVTKCIIILQYFAWLFNPSLEHSSNLPVKYPTPSTNFEILWNVYEQTDQNCLKMLKEAIHLEFISSIRILIYRYPLTYNQASDPQVDFVDSFLKGRRGVSKNMLDIVKHGYYISLALSAYKHS